MDVHKSVDGFEEDGSWLEQARDVRRSRGDNRWEGRGRRESTCEIHMLNAVLGEQIERGAVERAVLSKAIGTAVDDDG